MLVPYGPVGPPAPVNLGVRLPVKPPLMFWLGFIGLCTLTACSLLLGYGASFLDAQYQPLNAVGLTASGLVMAFFSFLVGAAVLFAYGIPIYIVLFKKGKATWLNVLAAASIPCIAAALMTTWKGSVILFCFAVPIAVAMHVWHERLQRHE